MDYALQDFLLFSARTYWRLFERVNAETWPLAALAIVAGLVILAATIRPELFRPALAVLAAGWLVAGWIFIGAYYEPVHWALWPAPWLFTAEACALIATAFRGAAWRRTRTGSILAVYAVAVHPLTALYGRPLAGAEVALIAPDPTAMLTVALVSAVAGGWLRYALAMLPLGWLVQSAVTLYALDAPEWCAIAVVLLVSPIALMRRRDA